MSVFRLFGGSGATPSEAPCLRGERRGVLGGLVCRLREVASESLILKERTTYLYNSDNIIIYTALAFKLKLPELTLRPFQAIQNITDL